MSCDSIDRGNDFELIPTVEMETRNPVEGYFGSEEQNSPGCRAVATAQIAPKIRQGQPPTMY